ALVSHSYLRGQPVDNAPLVPGDQKAYNSIPDATIAQRSALSAQASPIFRLAGRYYGSDTYGILFVPSLAGITENADHWRSSTTDSRSLALLWSMDRICSEEKARCHKCTYHTRHRCYCFLCSISFT